MKKHEPCRECHDQEADDIGRKIVSGEKLEPKPIKGKPGVIPVTVQATYDAANLYVRAAMEGYQGRERQEDGQDQPGQGGHDAG